ncbi:hypothetical protein SORBI_3001G417100 [Sorghum bicolor]|uniref:Uncharacterized protein n=1 Tax=Sorghum bicolor TaxID=4558 RepID=A0A1B6QP26_SORBI|nr:hypothetical protein SORBI_3001G417100 [Sorghum bicolor]
MLLGRLHRRSGPPVPPAWRWPARVPVPSPPHKHASRYTYVAGQVFRAHRPCAPVSLPPGSLARPNSHTVEERRSREEQRLDG